MAWNLIHLGTHFYDDEMIKKGKSILAQVTELIVAEPEYMSNWGVLALEVSDMFTEVIVVGPKANDFANEINQQFIPNKIIAGTTKEMELSPFEMKTAVNGETTIYVCYDKTCKRPVTSVAEALKQIQAN